MHDEGHCSGVAGGGGGGGDGGGGGGGGVIRAETFLAAPVGVRFVSWQKLFPHEYPRHQWNVEHAASQLTHESAAGRRANGAPMAPLNSFRSTKSALPS
eukprot:1153393-Pleurochrysis_carterae.AAC.2